MREGDVGHSVYLVLAGLVRVERSDRQMPPEELGPGSVVGRTGPTDGSLRLATVTAVEDTEVLELRLRSHPCWKPLPSSPELAVPRLRFIPRP